MTDLQVHSAFKATGKLITSGELKLAFDKVRVLTYELKSAEITAGFEDLLQHYRLLLNYYANGTEDAERQTAYRKIQAKLFVLVSELREELLTQSSTNFEYAQKRYFNANRKKNIPELLDFIQKMRQQIAIAKENDEAHTETINSFQIKLEQHTAQLFSAFWLQTHLTADEKESFTKITLPEYDGLTEKCMIVTALTFSLLRMFEEEKLTMLFDCCQSEDVHVRQRALVGLCFVLTKYNQFLPLFPFVRDRLMLLTDDNLLANSLQSVILQIIGTAQTESITRKMNEEIIPQLTKIAPKLTDKANEENLFGSEDWDEENPEWQKMIEESGLSEKLQELTEMQMEGADVYMSTFAMLKSFPFFSEFSNWFIPFSEDNTALKSLFDKTEGQSLVVSLMKMSLMCNSDKYSFCLSVMQMPENERKKLMQMANMEAVQMEEIEKDETLFNPEKHAANVSKQYIQDLYRFFKLNPYRHDFSDIFSAVLLLHRTYLFRIFAANSDIKPPVANHYFAKNLYPQAISMFEDLAHDNGADAALFQKLGYAYQQTADTEKALEAYLKADLIQPDHLWTLKKIALCYRSQQNFEKALEIYQHIDFLNGEKTTAKFNVAMCYIELGKYKEARKAYTEMEKSNDSPALWRAIVWCAFVAGNLSEAEYYNGRNIEDAPTALDYLYAGHIAWCRRELPQAAEYYLENIDKNTENIDLLTKSILADEKHLLANGIEQNEIPLFMDYLRLRSGEN
ncbi:MAG: tetratricopeptide repeat protein [Prevotellaceae bacterium]|jgi:tetratricopeptide (TPR) repeat protein|nr:tetratricopeptide repeat protein [Prevotellaceae bacterium]